jgi:hypothetical protein
MSEVFLLTRRHMTELQEELVCPEEKFHQATPNERHQRRKPQAGVYWSDTRAMRVKKCIRQASSSRSLPGPTSPSKWNDIAYRAMARPRTPAAPAIAAMTAPVGRAARSGLAVVTASPSGFPFPPFPLVGAGPGAVVPPNESAKLLRAPRLVSGIFWSQSGVRPFIRELWKSLSQEVGLAQIAL